MKRWREEEQEEHLGGGRSWGILFCEGWIGVVVEGLVGRNGWSGGSGGTCRNSRLSKIPSFLLPFFSVKFFFFGVRIGNLYAT